MPTYHTIIVGAGPAGLACATILARHGCQVLVLERNQTIGPKVCAGGIPHNSVKRLGLPDQLLEKSFPVQYLSTPRQKAKIKSLKPIITTINRQKLGGFMLARAQKAGAIIWTNATVKKVTDSHVYINTPLSGGQDDRLAYRYLVGADGSSSIVRKFLNLPINHVGVGIQYQVPGNFSEMEWHFSPEIFHSGYAWIFPHKDGASIGAYADRKDISPHLLQQNFLAWAKTKNIPLANLKSQAALVNYDYQGWQFNNIFLTGDAAGLASGLTGEGIAPAIISGEAAAESIVSPGTKKLEIDRLISKHKRHKGLQKLFASNKVVCHIGLEVLTSALRVGLLPFRHIEMS